MNLATIVLIVLAVHFGGAEIDLAQEVSLEWFRDSRLERSWELRSRDDGLYTFVGADSRVDGSRVFVERLSEPERTYTVTHIQDGVVEIVSVVALVDLPRGSAVGRASPSGTPIYIEHDRILAAIAGRGGSAAPAEDTGSAGEEVTAQAGAGDDGADRQAASGDPETSVGVDQPVVPDDPAVGRYEITGGRGLIALIDAASAQVLTVRF